MASKMRINDPGCREALAGEYVLGTLQGAARRRFERLLRECPDLRYHVVQWEKLWAPMAEVLDPVAPPKRVWRAVESTIAPNRPRWWDSVVFWRPFGAVAAALLVAVTLLFGTASREGAPGDYVFVVQGDAGHARWVVTASAGARHLNIRPVEPPGLGPDQQCRLWWHPGDGGPRMLAVLPEGEESIRVRLPPEVRDRWWRDEMAVTISPADRAPAAGPSGEEVFRGRWAPLT